MAKTLTIYPFADVSIQHAKSSTDSTGYALVNEKTNNTTGYLSHTFSTGATTYVSSFGGLDHASDVTIGKIRINSISSVNLYLDLTKGSNATLNGVNIFGNVTINGNTYTSSSYNPTGAVSTSLQTLAISNANINQIYSSVSTASIGFSISTTGRYTTDSDKNNNSYLRIYNANVTISYDDVFTCAVNVISGHGITQASCSDSDVVDGGLCTFNASVQDKYEFYGWYDNADFEGNPLSISPSFTTVIREDTTLYPMAVKEDFVPPDEDPQKVYYPITISSINAITNPMKGTTKVESGTSKTITITPSDPLLTLALDNGVDITSQLVLCGDTINVPTVATAPNANYGFTLNNSTHYYTSTNQGQNNSASVCRVTFNFPVDCLVTFQYINYSEATYDYGIFGNVDVALATTNASDSNAYKILSQSSDNTPDVKTLTYEIDSGTHFIDVKYRKDGATNSNNDNLQFKILSIEPIEARSYYVYELSSINQEHSLTFVFGDVEYYFVTSQTDSNAGLYPNGQTVVLPGDDYRLTIIPENNRETIILKDNDYDVSSQLERVEIETEKDGQAITVLNYVYRLNNISQGHVLTVETTKPNLAFSIKINGTYMSGNFIVKANGAWVQIQAVDIYAHNGVKWLESLNDVIKTNNILFGGNIG